MSAWIVDRIEGALAVLEGPDGLVERPLSQLPDGLVEGEVLDETLRRVEGAAARMAEAEARLRRLRAASPPDGDFTL